MELNDEEKMQAVKTGGFKFTKPVISRCEVYLFCPSGNHVEVYSIETGEICQKLFGHKDVITGLALHPSNQIQVLTSSLDGTVNRWDFFSGTLLKSYSLNVPIHLVLTTENFSNLFLYAGFENDKLQLRCMNINDEKEDNRKVYKRSLIQIALPKSENLQSLISLAGNQLVVVESNGSLTYFNLNTKQIVKHKLSKACRQNKKKITCVAVHPTEDMCLTGHADGVIRKCLSLSLPRHQLETSENHWHSSAVNAVCWSESSEDYYSAGKEGVLVEYIKDKKDFLPRLGATINYLAVSPSYKCTVHDDNSIKIIDNMKDIVSHIESFTAGKSELQCGAVLDPKSNCLVTCGKPGHLLFYDPQTNQQLMNLDVMNKNFVSSPEDLSAIEVTHVAFVENKENSFMATVEFDVKKKQDQKLKFWKWKDSAKQWSLDTVIPRPHQDSDVTSLHFNDNDCISTSVDGTAIVWTFDEMQGWIDEISFKHRGNSVQCSGYSCDNSLLAVGFDRDVVVKDAASFEDITTLNHNGVVKHIKFGCKKAAKFLVTCTNNFLHSWEIISGKLAWCLSLDSSPLQLVSDPNSQSMALLTKDNTVKIFSPCGSGKGFIHKLDFEVQTAAFFPNFRTSSSSQRSPIYIVSKEKAVYNLLTVSEAKALEKERQMKADTLHIGDETLQAPIFPNQSATSVQKSSSDTKITKSRTLKESVDELFQCGGAHNMQPITQITEKFITSLILDGSSQKDESEQEIMNFDADDQVYMEVDEKDDDERRDINSNMFKFIKKAFSKTKSSSISNK